MGQVTIPLEELEPDAVYDSCWVLGEDMEVDHDGNKNIKV